MQAKQKNISLLLIFEAIFLLLICVLIWWFLSSYMDSEGVEYSWVAIIIIPIVALFLIVTAVFAAKKQSRLLRDASFLAGALWELIRLMETSSKAASSKRSGNREDLLQKFAVDGAQRVAAGRPMALSDTSAIDLTNLAFELMDRNEKDGSGHGKKISSIRRGIFVFYMIVAQRQFGIAYRAMIEHMKIQFRSGEESGMDNFTDLKHLLGMPVTWPTFLDIETCQKNGLSSSRESAIHQLLDSRLDRIFEGVEYVPAGSDGIVFIGSHQILPQMREYIR